MIEEVKFVTETKAGTLIRVPATLEFKDGRIWFLKSPFALKDEIKAMAGSKWHGFDKPPRKIWSVLDCQRNRFQIEYLKGNNPYEWFDRDIINHEYTRPLMAHQRELSDAGLTYHYQIWAAEMGCIDGDAIVHVNRAGKGFAISLRELCYKQNGGESRGGKVWDSTIPTYIRGYRGGYLGLTLVKKVLFQGVKDVLRVTLASGKSLRLTDDHEVCVGLKRYGEFRRANQLVPGDVVVSAAPDNYKAPSRKVEQTPPANLVKTTKMGEGVWLDKDGYVRVGGMKGHPRYSTHGVYEHLLVVEEAIGRPVQRGEEVHHINGQRWDNRLENLMLCSNRAEHMNEHPCVENLRRGKLASSTCVAFDRVASIRPDGETDVYDVVCEGPYHNFVANGIVVHNCGKTLSAFEVMEKSGVNPWLYVGPKSVIPAIRREMKKWDVQGVDLSLITYDGLVRMMDDFNETTVLPKGVIFDESSKLKNHSSQRSQAAQALADRIRQKYGMDGYVIAMSGTPSPKSPLDWWSQAEIVFPGFLKEGSVKALEHRLAFMVDQVFDSGPVKLRIGWKDDERKCAICGELETDLCHDLELCQDPSEWHEFKPSVNEVALMHERLKGLVVVKHKKDCLELPDKRYRKVICKPNKSTLRVASALVNSCSNAVTGMTLLRELSDGFQYRDTEAGMGTCPHCDGKKVVEEWFDPTDPEARYSAVDMLDAELVDRLEKREVECPNCNGKGEVKLYTRTVREIPTPKEPALIDLLEENEEHGRIVVFAGFTGSVDRCVNICLKQRWDVVRCDGRGFHVFRVESDGTVTQLVKQDALEYWANRDNQRVAFVAHPESGGMGLTLTEACMAVFWSNSFKPEYRVQAEDRIHRTGIDENLGATIVDLIHLPTDERVLSVIQENRRLELLSMGEIASALEDTAWEAVGEAA